MAAPDFNSIQKTTQLTAYYATGQWLEGGIKERSSKFAIVGNGQDKELTFSGKCTKSSNVCFALFTALENNKVDPNSSPLEIQTSYWLQAPVPKSLYDRLTTITENSGKFLIFISRSELPSVWEKFKVAYEAGKLGYGLRCSTEKKNPNASQENKSKGIKLITVHTEDAFDMQEVARVAWEIDKILDNWQGTLQYMTDKATLAKCLGNHDGAVLYPISSYSFIAGAIHGGKDKKTYAHFAATFNWRFKSHAEQALAALKAK